jgi:enterochelin esterase-like enzyme
MSVKWLILVVACGVLLGVQSGRAAQDSLPIVNLNEPVVGFLEGGASAVWAFEGEAGQRLHISAERFPPNPTSQLDVLLEVLDSAGQVIAMDDDSSVGKDAMLLDVVLPSEGIYSLRVSNLTAWAGGSYQLWVAESEWPANCQTSRGAMLRGEMPSAIVGYPVRYRVFMPPCYEAIPQRYPYVILGHGSNSSDELWDDLGIDEAIVRGVALGRLPPLAVVLPWGGELANINTFGVSASWEYVIIDELIPYMEATYCLGQQRELRAIGGISRGGFWAFIIALRHPDLFISLGGHSPFFDLYHAPPTHNPLDLVMASPPNPPLRIWMDRGQEDYAQVNIDLAHERLVQNGIAHDFQLYPVGQHENAYWSAHLDDYLQFYAEGFYGPDALPLPPCP